MFIALAIPIAVRASESWSGAIEIDASLDERDRVSRVVTNDVLVWLRRP